MTKPTRHRLAAWALLGALGALAAAPARAQTEESQLRRAFDVEQRLLRQQLTDYAGARQQELTAEGRLDEVATQISQLVQRPSPSSVAVVRLRQQFDEAVAAAAAAAERSRRLRDGIDVRMQTLALLSSLIIAAEPAAVADALSGVWQVSIAPDDVGGTFELHQDGTVVSGTYRLDNGLAGSLRGTFVDGRVLLERIDGRAGFDAVFEAYVAPREGRMAGFWQPTDLATGGSGGGGWAATKLRGGPGE